MKERPILFSGPMVRAILDDRKTQTRRIVKPQPTQPLAGHVIYSAEAKRSGTWRFATNDNHEGEYRRCPYGLPGDRLWVRETFCQKAEDGYPVYTADGDLDSSCYHYAADGYYVMKCDGDGGMEFTKAGREASPWKSPIHMSRCASRITLEVTAVRVERLQEITEADAIAEGLSDAKYTARSEFIRTWKLINGVSTWDANPWVWVVSFKRFTTKDTE